MLDLKHDSEPVVLGLLSHRDLNGAVCTAGPFDERAAERNSRCEMPRFSLIVGTKGRPNELGAFLRSVEVQERQDLEIFVVDQNEDDRVVPILKGFVAPERIVHLRPTPGSKPGVSSARNQAIPLCNGDIVAFPDDDCWYPPHLLDSVDAWFKEHRETAILTVTSRDELGSRSANQWNSDLCDLRRNNVFRTTATSTIFVQRAFWPPNAFFDEGLGPGSWTGFNSSDDTDYVLMLISHGLQGKFTQLLHVGHPSRQSLSSEAAKRRSFSYGLGMGRVMRKYQMFLSWPAYLGFDMVRAALNLAKGDRSEAAFRWRHGLGLIRGFCAGEPD